VKRFLSVWVALLWTVLLLANSPTGGVKGRVLSKMDRYPLEQTRVQLLEGASLLAEAYTDAKGSFLLEEIPDGSYMLVIASAGYLENRLPVAVSGGRVKNVFNILLSEINRTGDSWEDFPAGSTDIQRNIQNYLRYGRYSVLDGTRLAAEEVTLAGVRMDEMDPTASGYLAEALRENRYTTGAGVSETAFGGSNGLTEISATANRFRSGFYGSLSTDNTLQGLKAEASYGSGPLSGGWTLGANVTGIGWNKDAFDPYAVYLGVGKSFTKSHQLNVAFMRDQEPVSFLRYDYTPSQKFQAYTTVLGRFAREGSVLHAAGGFNWKASRLLRLSGGMDGRRGFGESHRNWRAEAWLSGLFSIGPVGLHAAFRGGRLASDLSEGTTYSAKAGLSWAFVQNWLLSANTSLFREIPTLPRAFSSDVNLTFYTNSINLKLTGFYEKYLGSNNLYTGLDLAFKTPVFVVPNLSLQGEITAGQYGMQDRFGFSQVYGGLSWSARAWFADAGYVYNQLYQMVDLSAGKTWSLQNRRQVGLAMGLRPCFGRSTLPTRFSFRVFCRI